MVQDVIGFLFFRQCLIRFLVNFLILTLVCMGGSNVVLHAQSAVSGKVTDRSDKMPLEYATVVARHKVTGEFSGGAITNPEGRYTLDNLKSGTYVFTFSYIGYKTNSIDVLIGTLNSNYNLGEIALAADHLMLSEVVISGKTDIVSGKLEKQTYNMDANISQSGGSVLEAMRNLPGIAVDIEGHNVTLRKENYFETQAVTLGATYKF